MIREREIVTLTRLLRETDTPGLKIAAVVGPGGVGKSHVLEEAFRAEDPRTLGYLHLSVDASNPQTRAQPAVGFIRPASILSVVVLPAAFGPSMAKNSPRATSIWKNVKPGRHWSRAGIIGK